MTIEIEGEEASMIFDFTDVFRKHRTGTWLYSSVIFNSKDAPPDLSLRPPAHRASGSGRSWKCTTLLGVPLPVSRWNGARVL